MPIRKPSQVLPASDLRFALIDSNDFATKIVPNRIRNRNPIADSETAHDPNPSRTSLTNSAAANHSRTWRPNATSTRRPSPSERTTVLPSPKLAPVVHTTRSPVLNPGTVVAVTGSNGKTERQRRCLPCDLMEQLCVSQQQLLVIFGKLIHIDIPKVFDQIGAHPT
jgi:hypothetical protein